MIMRANLWPWRVGMLISLAAGAWWLLIPTGCSEKPMSRMNAPPQGFAENRNDLREYYIRMTDNALLADMSMSAVHFAPHSPELNGLGVRRLNRYASILKIYGGTLRYDGAEKDEQLKTERLSKIKEYLVASGLGADQFVVTEARAGGAGINAAEAIEIRQATNFNPEELSGGSSGTPAVSAGGSK